MGARNPAENLASPKIGQTWGEREDPFLFPSGCPFGLSVMDGKISFNISGGF